MQKSSTKIKERNFIARKFIEKRQAELRKLRIFFDSEVPELTANMKTRLFLVWGLLITSGLGLALNLYNLQIVRGPELKKQARRQQMVAVRPFMLRRPVLDRNLHLVAIDRPAYTLYAHPKLFGKSKEYIAKRLASILNKNAGDLEKKFAKQKSGILIASSLPEEIADRIYGLRLDGLDLSKKYSRFYPQQKLFADVVGYVNSDRRGQAGVEYSQEKLLERSSKTLRISRTGNGLLMPNHTPQGFFHDDDLRLQLTIDSRLQRSARTALMKQIKKFNAKRGAVIVMDAWNGAIMAMVSQPTYNPNRYSQADISLFRNWTVADLYEPGSTFKPLNVAIALETGSIQPDDVVNDSGAIKVTDHTIRNAELKSHGNINIAEVLKHSSNVGMVKIIQKLNASTYYGWLERIGLGQRLETDLPSAVASQLKPQEEFINSPIEPATTSFGQGFSITPLQLVQMHGALANGGKLVTPHVVKGLIDSKKQIHDSLNLPKPRQIFSPVTAQTVVEMMEIVVANGTGKAAKIPGYRIAGKTGTAQKASKSGGYRSDARITSFVSILPVELPRYVVLALVDEPKGAHAYGGTVAAPIVKSVMEALISLEKIAPSQPMN
ncbi:peptidoglycan D,D-transpeptidase FtsI family protein [Calothrix rhizosoleniae]|uniref:peptidoglycan D,D-transpeptidase FtsI family protein n=1 Tax=Calothrix rhizosoleniae TaxID=888997 RepID=UPI000B49A4D3|nr:penicillin-binding protein 2 [Calothrix rhizosoleniae]